MIQPGHLRCVLPDPHIKRATAATKHSVRSFSLPLSFSLSLSLSLRKKKKGKPKGSIRQAFNGFLHRRRSLRSPRERKTSSARVLQGRGEDDGERPRMRREMKRATDKQRVQSRFPQIWMVRGSIVTPDTVSLPACLCCLIARDTFALELRGAEQKSTAGEVFDLSASVSLMHHVETQQQIWGGTRRWCWVLSGSGRSARVCDDVHRGKWLRKSARTLIAVQMSTHAHTHTHGSTGCPALLKSSAFKQEGMKKAPPPSTPPQPAASLFRIIKHRGSSDNHNCQATDLHPNQSPLVRFFPSENVISHSSPGLKFEAARRDYLRISTPCVYPRHPPPTRPHPLRSAPPRLSSVLPCTPHLSSPVPLPVLSPRYRLSSRPACQDDFRLVWPDLAW